MTLKRSANFRFVIVSFFFLSFIALSIAWDISSMQDTSKQCAEIFFQASYQGPLIKLQDDEQYLDLTDLLHHFGKKEAVDQAEDPGQQEETDDATPERATESANKEAVSFRVREGCKLRLSSHTYFKDNIYDFVGDEEEMGVFVPKSASCECPKVCKCEDIQLRKSECARAYLGDDCTKCKAPFTNMRESDTWKVFPEKWSPFVRSIVLRDGCEVSMKHAHLGDQIQKLSSRSSRITENVQQMGNITQYHCKCSQLPSNRNNANPTPPPNQNFPPLINIPKSKGGINTLMFSEELRQHPGLIAALQSLRNKRSSRNAYILLLGMTGSGKSSAVNLLFDHPNITKVGDFVSTTSQILQFSIPVPIPELGMNNTCLHVIDTPGIGDTRGLSEDARFLASLEDFLNKNEDLRRNLPNVVLIFAKFSDNRFRGEGSSFVKMLRTLDLFKDRIIDKKSTNVIFVLTHFMSETKEITRDPTKRINSIRQVIQEFSTLPRPIHIVLAENKPEDTGLFSINGFYQLPNGEFYPKNLFDQMQRNLNGDPVGEAIIRSAFSNSDNFQITGKIHRLVYRSNAKVTKYLGTLASLNIPVSGTEVSTELSKSYGELDSTLKSRYPDAFTTLQRTLFMRNIIRMTDLPQSSSGILRLFESIHINPVTLNLLESSFNITIPELKGNLMVGSGYSLVSDTPLSSKIFQTGTTTNQSSDLLFRVPDAYHVGLQNQLNTQFQVFTGMPEFIQARMSALGVSENALSLQNYKSSPTEHLGFNFISLSDQIGEEIQSPSSDEDNSVSQISWNSLSAAVDYHTFQIGLSSGAKFTEEFATLLEKLQPLNLTDSTNVGNWLQFFDRYGTHVVTQAFGGGSIQVKVEMVNADEPSPTNSEKFAILSETMGNIVQELANELIGKDAIYEPPAGVKYEFHQRGGNHKYYWSNFSELDDTKNIDEWKDSLRYDPVVLTNRLQLVPISEIVKELGGNEDGALMIENAATALLNTSLLYIPVGHLGGEETLESRDQISTGHLPTGDFESMQQFASMFNVIAETNKQMQENVVQLMAESQAKRERQEREWQEKLLLLQKEDAENQKQRQEEERYNAEMQLKRDELEMQRQAQETALRLQLEQSQREAEAQQWIMMQELRTKSEQTMLTFINAENDRRAQIAANKKGWLDKTFDFLGNALKSAAAAALPAALMG